MPINIRPVLSTLLVALLTCPSALAETLPLPTAGNDIVGRLKIVYVNGKESLLEIGRRADLGYDQIVKANLNLNRWLPGDGAQVLLPREYILPDAPRSGIVVNLAELRMYYYPAKEKIVHTYPVSIGRMDWKTPLGVTHITRKDKNPPWYPTESIRAEHAADGDPLPKVFPGGHPDNPLGNYALRLALPTYLIHGTDERKSMGIGMRVTHGCMRMYPEDVEALFNLVAKGTKVNLVNQPVKVGWEGDRLFAQITTPLKEDDDYYELDFKDTLYNIEKLAGPDAYIDRTKVLKAITAADGILVQIGRRMEMPEYYDPPARPTE